MSRVHAHWGAYLPLLLTLLFGNPSVMGAQSAGTPTREEVGARIETKGPLAEEARLLAVAAEEAVQDSIRAAKQVAQDTIMVGPFRIVTLEGQAEMARDFFSGPVGELIPFIKGTEELFQNHTFVFSYGWWDPPVFAKAGYVYNVTLSRHYPARSVTNRVRAALGEALFNNLPQDEYGLGGVANHQSFLPSEDWSWVYRQLASAPYISARECLEGDPFWCWEATGVVDRYGSGDDWDTPEARRRLVESRYERYLWRERDRLSTRGTLVRGCLVLESDRACLLVLDGYHLTHGRDRKDYSLPLSGAARGTLVGEALRLGGEGSYGRLIANPDDPLRDRLAYAANMAPNDLVGEWRDRVVEARPNAQAGLLRSPVSLIFWLVFLMALAARSSRWRLG